MDAFDNILEWALNGTTIVLASSRRPYLIEKVQRVRTIWYLARENSDMTTFIFMAGTIAGIVFMAFVWWLKTILR